MDCFGTYFTHAQTCDLTRVQSAIRTVLLRQMLHTCPKLWCNSGSKCYGMDCFGTYFTHAQTCDVTRVQSATEWTASIHTSHAQTCDVTRVRSATEWTASVHTSHMSKAVMQLVFKVLRNGLLRYILHTCPNLWCNPCSKCYGMDCFGTYFTHAQSCDVTHVQSATEWTASVQSVTEWTASVHTSHMPKAVM